MCAFNLQDTTSKFRTFAIFVVVELKAVFQADNVGTFLPPCETLNVCDLLLFAFKPIAKESRLTSPSLVYILRINYSTIT
jgi:hypothetical protein